MEVKHNLFLFMDQYQILDRKTKYYYNFADLITDKQHSK